MASDRPITYFEWLQFANGTLVEPLPNGVVVFVGPNNAGKSTALGELAGFAAQAKFTDNNRDNRVFASGSMSVPEAERWSAWLTQFIDESTPPPIGQLPGTVMLRNWNTQLAARLDDTHQWLTNSPNVHQLQGFSFHKAGSKCSRFRHPISTTIRTRAWTILRSKVCGRSG